MNPFKMLKTPCAKCPYKLGQIKTLVNPCPACKTNGYSTYRMFTNKNTTKSNSDNKKAEEQ